jgi:hypothetical protein
MNRSGRVELLTLYSHNEIVSDIEIRQQESSGKASIILSGPLSPQS